MIIKKIAQMATAILFSAIIGGFGLLTLLLPKEAVSQSERRELAKMPTLSLQTVVDGTFFNGLTDYVTDHFALREAFRTLNTVLRVDVLQQPDVGGVFEADGYLFEPTWPMDEQAMRQNTEKLQSIVDAHFAETPVYISIIPDKADYTDTDCLKLDTKAVTDFVQEHFSGAYIDITETLTLTDYYRTDTHWKQEMLEETANALVIGMGGAPLQNDFEWKTLDGPFYGVLWGRYAKPLDFADVLCYGVNDATENAVVRDLTHPEVSTVYVPRTASSDKYDVFLSGATPIIETENPNAETDEHLVLFRDSFGSSIAPWLLTRYEKITIIDTRYVSSAILAAQTDLTTADKVLFLYSTAILNTGGILK